MRVLRVFHGGGVPAYQERDVALSDLGHDITLVVPKWFRELPEVTVAVPRKDKIQVLPVALWGPRRNPFYFYNPFELARVFSHCRPVLVDIHEEPYSLAALSVLTARIIARSKSKVIFRSSQNVYKKYPLPFSLIQRWLLKVSTEAYVPSLQAQKVLELKNFEGEISVIGNGVSLPNVADVEQDSNGPIELLYVGRLIDRKGVLDLVRATVKLDGRARLTIVGSGPQEEVIRSVIASSELDQAFTLVGAVPHEKVGKYLLSADVICVPSHELDGWSEQFSRALVEGMAYYCIPVVSNSGALPEVSGGVVAPFAWGDTTALAATLEGLCGLESLDGLKRRAHDSAVNRYSWAATSAQISQIYERVLS